MIGRWVARGDRPVGHTEHCVCAACWTRLELVGSHPEDPAGVVARWVAREFSGVTTGWAGVDDPWPPDSGGVA